MAILNSLYPPVVPDTMPAFDRTKSCPIYFSISIYDSYENIATDTVQVSIVDLNTNISALNPKKYPTGIKITNLGSIDSSLYGFDYRILINPADLTNGFKSNTFYKVQLRFTKTGHSTKYQPGSNSWLEANQELFSQWSKPCVIKGISIPTLTLNNFSENKSQTSEMILSNPLIDIIGKLKFSAGETEYLKNYNVKILDGETKNILFRSQDIYPIAKNELNYVLPYALTDGEVYYLQISYITNNFYQNTQRFKFIVIEYYGTDTLNASISATPNINNGSIKIKITSLDGEPFLGSFTIRRTSSESNFSLWEDIKTVSYKNSQILNYEWQDRTIESGIIYEYCVQKRNSNGIRGPIVRPQDSGNIKYVMCQFEDIFLTTADQQLSIKFNPTLSDFKYNVTESQQVTIGSKYPYIKRNANNYFRTFSIGGLITAFIDRSDWYTPIAKETSNNYQSQIVGGELKNFTSKAELFGNNINLYEDYNEKNNISEYEDVIYQRKFREKVYEFLYKNDIKLFRSNTEGNILIKLMNVAFQPVNELNRQLYSFTATAVEIDQANLSNYNKYKINIIGDYLKKIQATTQTFGILQGTFSSRKELFKTIEDKYNRNIKQGFIAKTKFLKYLKIEIDSEPYPVYSNNGKLQPLQVKNQDEELSKDDAKFAALGYIVSINGENYFIPSQMERNVIQKEEVKQNNQTVITNNIQIVHNGTFELKNIKITNLSFLKKTTALLTYVAQIEEIEDTRYLIKKFAYEDVVGQLYGVFNPQESLSRLIYMKYFENDEDYYRRLVDLIGIRAEGPPGAVLYVQDSKDKGFFNRHILENGFLRLRNDDVSIFGLYFGGIHLIQSKNSTNFFEKNGLKIDKMSIQIDENIYENIEDIFQEIEQREKVENGTAFRIKKYGIENIDENGYPKLNYYNAENSNDESKSFKALFIQSETLNDNEGWIVSSSNGNNFYDLAFELIEKDNSLIYVYYYGVLYPLLKAEEISKQFSKADIRHIRDNEYIQTGEVYEDFSNLNEIDIIPNGVYLINNEYYIYYHSQWYPFDQNNHDVLCPVEGIIDYYCQTVKGVYNNE